MLQKTQWTLVAAALAVGALLAPAAQPGHAQVRIRLTAPVKGPLPTGIQTGGGIVKPPSSPAPAPVAGPPVPAPAPVVKPPAPVVTPSAPVVTPPPAPVVKPPAPVVTSPTPTVTPRTTPTSFRSPSPKPAPAPAPTFQSGPQGFSAGPTLLGQPRIPLGHLVDRIPPDFDGDGYIETRKLPKRR